jgi:glycerol-3-phosphate dehydrogenase
MNRDETLASLRNHPEVTVLIVGAGINGIGTFRDLALNGVDVLLIDRADFCSGASAASSHMAHGGIRYLENGEFRLVREAVQERNFMIVNAPHIVRPLPTTIPIFQLFSGLLNAPLKFLGLLDRPSERGSLVIKIGLMLYDAYTGRQRIVPHHRFMNRHESLRHWPKLHPAVVHTATYYDGAILQPERLGLELILDAEAANARAMALNYVSLGQEGKRQVVLNDQVKGKSFEVRPQILINAAGPWIDLVDQAVGCETRFIGGTKGSHLVLDHAELRKAIGDHEFFFENKDGRIVLIFPLYDRILVGTSDLAVDDPDAVFCTEEEVDYFLEMIRRVFPAINVSRSHIVFRFSGVRPLAASHSRTTGQITRDHEIQVLETAQTGLPFPVYALVGGKWTSWRAFSEQVTDKCLAHLGIPRKVSTRELSIGGGREYPTKAVDRKRILERITDNLNGSSESAEVLFERYGMGALAVSEFASAHGDGPLEAIPTFSRQEIAFMAAREKIVHLDDLLLRRSMLAMLGYVTRQGIVEAADVLAAVLDWDEGRRAIEVSRTLEILKDKHQVEL